MTDISETMVERVARALCKVAGLDPDERVSYAPIDANGSSHDIALYGARWETKVVDARAAIIAMVEPTNDMLTEARRAELWAMDTGFNEGPINVWRAMIGAALGDQS